MDEYFVIRVSTCTRCGGIGIIQKGKGKGTERCYECDGEGKVEDRVSLQTALEDTKND